MPFARRRSQGTSAVVAAKSSPGGSSDSKFVISLARKEGGSMALLPIPGGVALEASDAQLRYLSVCLDIAINYNDEELLQLIDYARRHYSEPKESQFCRDPNVADRISRRNREWTERYLREERERKSREPQKTWGL